MNSAHDVTLQFEAALCEYTGARFAVTTTSCTQAILMALAWRIGFARQSDDVCEIEMPRLSYVGVPASIAALRHRAVFRDEDWQGEYQFRGRFHGPFWNLGVWDSARRFTSDMYWPGALQCVSFHATKILADTQGGAILHDDPAADRWLRRARFDGRTEGADPKTDQVQFPSWHAYLSPDVAARLLWKLSGLPRHNADLPRSDYPDLSTLEAFK